MGRFVVVEDDEDVCRLLVQHLKKRYGRDVVAFGQASPALDELRREPEANDLMLVDLGLPDFSGFELITRIRADEQLDTLPIIVLTARSGLQEHARALDVGADDFLEKPFSLKVLDKKIRALLGL